MTAIQVYRPRFKGMMQIARFNWTKYAGGAVALALVIALMWLAPLPRGAAILLIVGAGVGSFWMILSLIVSHWVYDRSALCRWSWMRSNIEHPPRSCVNIHAGFDETSEALAALFPSAAMRVLDIFDPVQMTEPSIARARRNSPSHIKGERADFRRLPVVSGTVDLVTLLLAAHEIRQVQARHEFFLELRRILAPDGCIILVEHLRDAPNFAAFGPGFLHFHSRATWRSAIAEGGMTLRSEFSITPFVRVFIIGRNP